MDLRRRRRIRRRAPRSRRVLLRAGPGAPTRADPTLAMTTVAALTTRAPATTAAREPCRSSVDHQRDPRRRPAPTDEPWSIYLMDQSGGGRCGSMCRPARPSELTVESPSWCRRPGRSPSTCRRRASASASACFLPDRVRNVLADGIRRGERRRLPLLAPAAVARRRARPDRSPERVPPGRHGRWRACRRRTRRRCLRSRADGPIAGSPPAWWTAVQNGYFSEISVATRICGQILHGAAEVRRAYTAARTCRSRHRGAGAMSTLSDPSGDLPVQLLNLVDGSVIALGTASFPDTWLREQGSRWWRSRRTAVGRSA